ncbi:MAG: hypothetical protein AAGE52_02890 [Myxococcota bacterium]
MRRPRRRPAVRRTKRGDRERGVALIIAITAIAILSVVLADFHESTGTAYAIAAQQRDQLRAEYMARSGLNLTRLLVSQRDTVKNAVAPIYQPIMRTNRTPDLPVWVFANEVLKPFCDYEAAQRLNTGVDLGGSDGLGETNATCEIVAFAENAKINVNAPLHFAGDQARRSIAMQLFSMMGGYQSPSPYDPLFQQRDRDGQFTGREDVVAALIDWWDYDQDRTVFDPGRAQVSSSGSEDDLYRRLDDPYDVKNAPFDSLEELRLVRGIGDDFWSTFVEPRPDEPDSRIVTIYGSGRVNINEAPPEVLLARVCSFIETEAICANSEEAAKFIQLLRTARSMIPLPLFPNKEAFLDFIQGRGGANGLYPMLQGFLGDQSVLLFQPATLPANRSREVADVLVVSARIITVEVTGLSGCREIDEDTGECAGGYRGRVKLRTVLNFHERWTPPPPNAGRMPGLGIFHYYRVE